MSHANILHFECKFTNALDSLVQRLATIKISNKILTGLALLPLLPKFSFISTKIFILLILLKKIFFSYYSLMFFILKWKYCSLFFVSFPIKRATQLNTLLSKYLLHLKKPVLGISTLTNQTLNLIPITS